MAAPSFFFLIGYAHNAQGSPAVDIPRRSYSPFYSDKPANNDWRWVGAKHTLEFRSDPLYHAPSR
jgi:hypothetical protein